ncbi:hypothetical protein BDFG_09423, partial [Blastomyces dermatitidis ATCC 26199]
SSYIDRSISADNNELNVESLIKNLKNMIMKKLLMLYMTGSLIFYSALSVSFSATSLESSTLASVSGSPAPAIPAPATSASAIPAVTSAAVISSSCFKEMLHRLDELYFS